ncbi:hypothetical protein CDD81_5548 [Ophiocordyceps australis]|uniref:Uncharacterized protein n=1 Tax=Ophiocordyceps australis TaxID=1399860 RepID=A0A2C5Y7J6_9HYPO|nr:hypothetical protein CDD81_5548 [Ophiocordyceps australis]
MAPPPPSSRFQPTARPCSPSRRCLEPASRSMSPAARSISSPRSPVPSVASSRNSTHSSTTFSSSASSSINAIIFGQSSMLEEERQSFSRALGLFEPRPVVYWSSVEERMSAATKSGSIAERLS